MYVTNTTSPLFTEGDTKMLASTGIKTVGCSSGTTRSTYRLFWSSVRIDCLRIVWIICILIVIAGSDCFGIRKNNQQSGLFFGMYHLLKQPDRIVGLPAYWREPHCSGQYLLDSDAMVVVKDFLVSGLELLVFCLHRNGIRVLLAGHRTNGRWSWATPQSQHANRATPLRQPVSSPLCSRCGKLPTLDRERWPAKDATCWKCTKKGHYQATCSSLVKIGGVQAAYSEPSNDYFLGALGAHSEDSNDPWAVRAQNGCKHL